MDQVEVAWDVKNVRGRAGFGVKYKYFERLSQIDIQ